MLALVGCIVYMAPATLLAAALGDDGPGRLKQAQGRIWDGAAEVEYAGRSLGSLSWRFDATRLARGEAVFDWRLADTGHNSSGSALVGFSGVRCDAAGAVRGSTVRRMLAPYWIETAGDVTVEHIRADLTHDLRLKDLVGELSWGGGEVRYRLAGEHHRMVVPPLAGVLEAVDAQPALTVFGEGVDAPLLHVRFGADGWFNIGVTKVLTKIAGLPWPGNQPDHVIVIDVSERLF